MRFPDPKLLLQNVKSSIFNFKPKEAFAKVHILFELFMFLCLLAMVVEPVMKTRLQLMMLLCILFVVSRYSYFLDVSRSSRKPGPLPVVAKSEQNTIHSEKSSWFIQPGQIYSFQPTLPSVYCISNPDEKHDEYPHPSFFRISWCWCVSKSKCN